MQGENRLVSRRKAHSIVMLASAGQWLVVCGQQGQPLEPQDIARQFTSTEVPVKAAASVSQAEVLMAKVTDCF